MTVFNPKWKLTVSGVEYTKIAISDITHKSGRDDIYSQPLPSYLQVTLISTDGLTLPFDINDPLTLQIQNSSSTYVTIFGGNITDVTVEVGATGSTASVLAYTLIAMGSLVKLAKTIDEGILSQDEDGNQVYTILSSVLYGTWNDVTATQTWATYSSSQPWTDVLNLGLGEIDRPGLYTMEKRSSEVDTIYNIATGIANSAFGYLYEDNQGNIGYADADHRQTYLSTYGYTDLSAKEAIGRGLKTTVRSGDIRNDIYINYGNNYGSQKTATSLNSITLYGYKGETINSKIHHAADAQEIADRYISLRAYPQPIFDNITFPITSPEIDDSDRDALLGIFMGQPLNIKDLPAQIAGGQFEGYVEGWSWSTSFNQLFLTINISPTSFSQVSYRWNSVNIAEAWNTLSPTLTWEYATIVA
jgi:hypothetical protein